MKTRITVKNVAPKLCCMCSSRVLNVHRKHPDFCSVKCENEFLEELRVQRQEKA